MFPPQVRSRTCSLEITAEDRIAVAQQVTAELGKGKGLSQLLSARCVVGLLSHASTALFSSFRTKARIRVMPSLVARKNSTWSTYQLDVTLLRRDQVKLSASFPGLGMMLIAKGFRPRDFGERHGVR